MSQNPFTKIKYWTDNYGRGEISDQRAAQDFINCEGEELIAGLKLELSAVAGGRFDPVVLDRVIGGKRKQLFGTYDAWARLMLQWLLAGRR